jgi:predicted Zn-dependent protease with MMP-like domain
MVDISDKEFEAIIAHAMDTLPERFLGHAKNVAVVWEYDPSPEQRIKQQLRPNQTLFGLYEGIPLTKRGDNYSFVLPDKITIFKNPITHFAQTVEDVKRQVKHTLWHEIAHHYGLDHDRIHGLEDDPHTTM